MTISQKKPRPIQYGSNVTFNAPFKPSEMPMPCPACVRAKYPLRFIRPPEIDRTSDHAFTELRTKLDAFLCKMHRREIESEAALFLLGHNSYRDMQANATT